MKSNLFALLALFVYAIANTIIERKLSRVSPLASTTLVYLALVIISAPLVLFRNELGIKLAMPNTSHVWIIICCAGLFFVADLAWFQAYHTEGARLEQIAATFVAFPIVTALMKGVSTGAYPTKSDVLSWVIVAIGLAVSIRQPLR